ncbi:MAG: phosphonate ABC transporter, permease protein PhnE [Alphaproteobacteria bacterium]|nr:phosphonate ABC transporter, permease protein PhnE [Alphaproteobacteria bacterium]
METSIGPIPRPRGAKADIGALGAPYTWRTLVVLIAIAALLFVSARRVEVDKFLSLTGEAISAQFGFKESSQVGRGLSRVAQDLFPITLAYRTDVSRVADLDDARLPWLAYIETVQHREYRMNPTTSQLEETVSEKRVLVEPLGYLTLTIGKMIETIEIALWATILAVLLSLPLAYLGAANYTPSKAIYALSRGTVSLLRAIPELISALFLVLAFGFGPVAGFLALGLHGAGFLGKFYAEDIEAADKKPQDALRALGASKVRVLRLAVLPQVMPSYIAYTLYILDRNVRMATVIGLVGAGGIGQELKGRYDLFEYGNVATILVVIFVTVFVLDQISARLRARLIA